jgi:ABC-type transport system involved in multi-copper enzyme maturation permease subunit
MDITKHKKIAIGLHIFNALLFIAIGGILFITSMGFIACTGGETGDTSGCVPIVSMFFGIPLLIGLLPILLLVKGNTFTRGLLWVYAILIAVLLIPIGTGIGIHTIYYLKGCKV